MKKRNFLKNTILGAALIVNSASLPNEEEKLGYVSIENIPDFPDGTKAHCGNIKFIWENKTDKKNYQTELIIEANDKENWFVSRGWMDIEYKDGIKCYKSTEYPSPIKFDNVKFTMKLVKV